MSQINYNSSFNIAIDWLISSFRINNYKGSSAWQSRFFHPFNGWSLPYPETTGYIITTLFDLRNHYQYRNEDIGICIDNSIEWLLGLQMECGAFPGGHGINKDKFHLSTFDYIINNWHEPRPSVFNTGQILRGLIKYYYETNNSELLIPIEMAAKYLYKEIGSNGEWKNDAYAGNKSPSYFAYITSPLLESFKLIGKDEYIDNAMKPIRRILNVDTNIDNFIQNMSFPNSKITHTHTLGYTLQGLIECIDFLEGSLKDDCLKIILNILNSIFHLLESKKLIPGGFKDGFNPDWSYSCLTGNCQLGLCFLDVNKISPNENYTKAAFKILGYTISKQSSNGAISGSYPLWGKYMTLRYPNWSVKYFLDLMLSLNNIKNII